MCALLCFACAAQGQVYTNQAAYKLVSDGRVFKVGYTDGTNVYLTMKEFRTRAAATNYQGQFFNRTNKAAVASNEWFRQKRPMVGFSDVPRTGGRL